MKRSWVIVLLAPCLLGLVLFGDGAKGGAQPAPTPIGQLGGPVPLTPEEHQETPTPAPTPTEATPENETGAAQCTVEPLTIDEAMARLQGGGASAGSAPNTQSSADSEESVTTLRTFVACLNAGDYLRIGAITTPKFFATLVSGTGWPPNELPAKLRSLHPRESDLYLQIVETGPVLDQAGGDVAVTIVLLDPATPFLGKTEFGARFAQEGGVWLLADLKMVS
jgi:hypothetical protein